MIRRIADALILSYGVRRLGVACAAGALTALGLPPIGVWPVMFLTFPVLVLLIDGTTGGGRLPLGAARSAFLVGYAFGFGYFFAGLWWVGAAFLVERDVFGWLLPLGVAGLPLILSLFTGLGCALARLLWSDGPARIAALAAGLGLCEYLRATQFTGFPWNTFGQLLTTDAVTMQSVALLGIYALNTVAVFVAAAPAALLGGGTRTTPRGRVAVPLLAVLVLAGLAGYGALRLSTATDATVPSVTLRLVQPNLTQTERHDRTRHLDIAERYFRLTTAGRSEAVTHVIWPESALPFAITAPGMVSRIPSLLSPGAVLIAGSLRADDSRPDRVLNALYVFDDQGRVLDRYDKIHLVPFGEYLPFADLATAIGLEPLTRVLAFVPGSVRRPMASPGAPGFLPLICYEIIFPERPEDEGGRPGWIVNISDDSWFGTTLGPHQHMHQARLRAVQEGLPVVRVTTTGVSGVIDAYGRVRAVIPLGVEGVIEAQLPIELMQPMGVLMGSWLSWMLSLVTALVACLARFGLISRKR